MASPAVERAVEQAVEAEPDTLLLRRFAGTRDEAAFAELVRRHGRLVWGVCRRRLARREDAEDAFQATFLILAAKAGSVRSAEALPGWLHRTACRAAVRVASAAPGPPPQEVPSSGGDAFAELARYEAAVAVDEELARLPRRYRDVLVLFHLEELDRKAVAGRLGATEAAAKALLARGRALLRARLARRGVALPLVLPFVADPVPAEAAASACRLGLSLTRGGVTALDLITVPSGVSAVLPWLTNKAAAIALAGAACLSLFIVTRDPAQAGAGGGKPLFDTVVPQADGPSPAEATFVADETTPPAGAADEPATAASTQEDLIARLREQNARLQTELAQLREQLHQGRQEEEEVARLRNEEEERQAQDAESRRQMQQAYEVAKRGPALDEELDSGTRLEFPNTPLRDALSFIADRHDLNMIIDERGVSEAAVDIDTNVDVILSGVSLRSALNILLDPLDLTYIAKNDVLLVTTKDRAAREVDSRVYHVRDLIDSPNGEATEIVEEVSRLLPTGEGGVESKGLQPVTAVLVPRGDRLLVTSTWAGHKRIEDVLRLLRANQ